MPAAASAATSAFVMDGNAVGKKSVRLIGLQVVDRDGFGDVLDGDDGTGPTLSPS